MVDAISENVTTVTIPIPLPFERRYGVNSTKHSSAVRLMQRVNAEQNRLIEEAAATLGITVSHFIKESAVNMAKAIKALGVKHAQHDDRSG